MRRDERKGKDKLISMILYD